MAESPEPLPVPALAAELRVALGRIIRKLRDQGRSGDFTPSQRAVLVHLEHAGSTTITALARVEGVRPQSMGATVATLEAADLVRRTADPADGRQTLLAITDACREMLRAGRAAREDWLVHGLEQHLSAVERARLADILPLLLRLANP